MRGWGLALAAGGFWAGIAWSRWPAGRPGPVAGAVRLMAGLAVLGALALIRTRRGGPARSRSLVHSARASCGDGGDRAEAPCSSRFPVAVSVGTVAMLGFALLGWGWATLRASRAAASPLAAMTGRLVQVEGPLGGDPRRSAYGWTATLRASGVEPLVFRSLGRFRTADAVWLQGRGPPPPVESGDLVRVRGALAGLDGEFGDYLGARGYVASVRVEALERRAPPRNPFLRFANAVRGRLRGRLLAVLPEREAGLLMGLLIGDTSRLDPSVEEDFRASGLSHLTAVSGANLAMFLAPVLLAASACGMGGRARFVVGIAAVAFFVLLTRAEPSVLRAGAMATLSMVGLLTGRDRSIPSLLGGAVLALLAIDPGLAHAVGFQLSVAATAGMALLADPLALRMPLPRPVAVAAGATLGAQAGVAPVLLHHFAVVPTTAIPANLLAFAAVAPAMLLGVVAGLGALAWPAAGRLAALVAVLPLRYLIAVADATARIPLPSITAHAPGIAALAVGLATVGAFGWWLRSGRRPPRLAVAALVVALPAFVWGQALRAGSPEGLRVTFFDVGQGDAALVRSPEGAAILIDGGPDPQQVAVELQALGVRRLDLLVASHAHADHVAGLPAVLARFGVSLAVEPGCRSDSPARDAFLAAVSAAGVPLRHPRAGERIRVGDVSVHVLGPETCARGTESDDNNASLVLRVEAADGSVLFPGDAEEPAQRELLESPLGLRADVLKVPHHGGATSVEPFFDAVGARVAVVSVGPNRYGHPAPEVLAALAAAGSRVVRTDGRGDVTVTFEEGATLLESTDA